MQVPFDLAKSWLCRKTVTSAATQYTELQTMASLTPYILADRSPH